MKTSLTGRLLTAASAALAAFLGLTGVALDQASQLRSETAAQNRLQGQLFGLLAAADINDDGVLLVPRELPEERFSRINSGLYARVVRPDGTRVWRSDSLTTRRFVDRGVLAPGEVEFGQTTLAGGEPIFQYRFGVAWEDVNGVSVPFVVELAEDLAGYRREIGAFRKTLWSWLGGAAVVLLVVQGGVLRWSLQPLRTLAEEINQIELGERDRLNTDHPRELKPLADNVNALLQNEHRLRQRYRNTLDDLAHSLKTPLAVLRAWLEQRPERTDREPEEQIDRMHQIVEYQLRRAAAGRVTFARPIEVEPCVRKIHAALDKVYRDKRIHSVLDIEPGLMFFGDAGDLMEVVGNILDNAYKYCHGEVVISCVGRGDGSPSGVKIVVENDGPGFPHGIESAALRRGVRADTSAEGQGIGLAAVQDIVAVYDGQIKLHNIEGGARVTILFPPT